MNAIRRSEEGQISPTLPFARKTAVSILKQDYKSSEEAAQKIPAAFENFYKANYPQVYSDRRGDINHAAEAVMSAYRHNVFPEMKVTWGTYTNNLGHTDFTGCFRCHDESHTANNGKTITQDCSACHNLLASEEKSPKILVDLGLEKAPAEAAKKEEPKKK